MPLISNKKRIFKILKFDVSLLATLSELLSKQSHKYLELMESKMAKFLLFNFLPIMIMMWPAVFLVIFADLHSQPDILTILKTELIRKRKF